MGLSVARGVTDGTGRRTTSLARLEADAARVEAEDVLEDAQVSQPEVLEDRQRREVDAIRVQREAIARTASARALRIAVRSPTPGTSEDPAIQRTAAARAIRTFSTAARAN